jgi:hypothetical protein
MSIKKNHRDSGRGDLLSAYDTNRSTPSQHLRQKKMIENVKKGLQCSLARANIQTGRGNAKRKYALPTQ